MVVRPGVKYRITKITDKFSDAEVILDPGTESFIELSKKTKKTYKIKKGKGKGIMVKGNHEKEAGTKDETIEIPPNTKHQLKNPHTEPWHFTLRCEPAWNPDDSYYQVGENLLPGSEVWFEISLLE